SLARGREEERGGAVVERAAVARRDGAALAEGGLQLRQLLERRIRARTLVAVDDHRLLSRDRHRQELGAVAARLVRRQRPLVRAERELVLLLPRDAVVRGDVLRR